MDETLGDLAADIGKLSEASEEEEENMSVAHIIQKYSAPKHSATSSQPLSPSEPVPVVSSSIPPSSSVKVISNMAEENCSISPSPLAWWSFVHKDHWILVVEERDTVPFNIKLDTHQVTIFWTLNGIFYKCLLTL